MIDVLTFNINESMQIDLTNNIIIPRFEGRVKLILEPQDFIDAFKEARLLSLTEEIFLKALSWYRKGKYTQDPFDKFLAFWNSIETVAGYYNPNKERMQKERNYLSYMGML